MAKKLEDLKQEVVSSQDNSAPDWLPRLLKGIPGLPSEATPHNRPTHADLQAAIADASFHPAIEACLHLINSDLYSAHFLVRKAQGGSRYSDWLHAILHKLEGDFRNAKMWYTDLGNNNKGAVEGSSNEKEEPSREGENVASKFLRFHQFWFVPSTNGGSGERASASGLNLTKADGLPRDLGLTAHQHTDLVFLAALVSKAKAKSSFTSDVIAQEVEKHYEATTLSADKIKDSKACFPVEEMQSLYKHLQQANDARETVADLTRLELVWMLSSLTKDFGWKKYGVAETMDALKLESTPAQASLDSDRKDKAANMVFEPGAGQRRF